MDRVVDLTAKRLPGQCRGGDGLPLVPGHLYHTPMTAQSSPKRWYTVRVYPHRVDHYWHLALIEGQSVAYTTQAVAGSRVPYHVKEEWGIDTERLTWFGAPCDPVGENPYAPTGGGTTIVPSTPDRRVYFIQGAADGPVKIGVAFHPESRLREIQRMSPVRLYLLGTLPGGYDLEAVLHKQFAVLRSHGEWFHPGEELLAYIQEALTATT